MSVGAMSTILGPSGPAPVLPGVAKHTVPRGYPRRVGATSDAVDATSGVSRLPETPRGDLGCRGVTSGATGLLQGSLPRLAQEKS